MQSPLPAVGGFAPPMLTGFRLHMDLLSGQVKCGKCSMGTQRPMDLKEPITLRLKSPTPCQCHGFEFYGVSGGASAETTRTTREGVSETLNNVHTTDMISARSVTWNSHGHAWQARATTRDTCGGSLIVTTPEFALTPSRGSRPQCLPGYCYNGNDDEYCCTCARGGELAGVLACEIQRCPRQASATYLVGHGSGRSAPIAMNCGRELEDEEKCEVACGDYGDFTGRATLRCDHGVVVVEDDLTDCQFER